MSMRGERPRGLDPRRSEVKAESAERGERERREREGEREDKVCRRYLSYGR